MSKQDDTFRYNRNKQLIESCLHEYQDTKNKDFLKEAINVFDRNENYFKVKDEMKTREISYSDMSKIQHHLDLYCDTGDEKFLGFAKKIIKESNRK
jgi:hypothetical protein